MKITNTFTNPLYQILLEHIVIDNQISIAKNLYEQQAVTLMCSPAFSVDDRKVQLDNLRNILLTSQPQLNNLLLYVIGTKILNEEKAPLNEVVISTIKKNILLASESTSFPIGKKSLINFFIQDIPQFKAEFVVLNNKIIEITNELIADKRSPEIIIDTYFSTNNTSDDEIISLILDYLKKKPIAINSSKLSKALILLKNRKIENLPYYIEAYENVLNEELLKWKTSDVWFAIVESEKIINSNLPNEISNTILETLKDLGASWPDRISTIQKDGIFLNLGSNRQIPNFSAMDDYLNYYCIAKIGRDKTVQLTMEEYEEYGKHVDVGINSILYDTKSIKLMFIFVGILSISITLICIIFFGDASRYLESFLEARTKPVTPTEIFNYVINPIVVFGVLVWWLVNLLHSFFRGNKIEIKTILMKNPIIQILNKFFNR